MSEKATDLNDSDSNSKKAEKVDKTPELPDDENEKVKPAPDVMSDENSPEKLIEEIEVETAAETSTT